jgi:hypothetical protein
MKYHVPGSLNEILSMPQMVARDVSALPLPVVTAQVKEYRKATPNEVRPETEAISFYCLEDMVATLRQKFHPDEPLPEWAKVIATKYAEALTKQGQRMFCYLLLIIAREARHVSSSSLTAPWCKKYGPEFLKYLKAVQDSAAMSATEYICNHAVDMTVGAYTEALATIFNKGQWPHGFGGGPWGKIAECISRMVHGQTSMALMIDSAYSLAHNGGPIFNKSMLYEYEYSCNPRFYKILDVQRSGQIPALVLEGELKLKPYITAELVEMVTEMNSHYPGTYKATVDYLKVEKSGSVQHYAAEKAKVKAGPPAPIFISGKKAKVVGTFSPFPGETVDVLQRVA